MTEFNGFDQLGGIADPEELQRKKHEEETRGQRLDYLIHKTFAQNESGQELLEFWRESLIMSPSITPNSTQFQAGIEEGKKEIIRNILLTIKKVEADK